MDRVYDDFCCCFYWERARADHRGNLMENIVNMKEIG